jgi:integrase
MKQEQTEQGKKSEHILSTPGDVLTPQKSDRFASKSKTSANYWSDRVFKFKRKNAKGVMVTDADYSCQLAFGGRRERFQLHTPNAASAASKAAAIYRDVAGKGWEEALRIHKPRSVPKVETLPRATVGRLIESSMRLSTARRESLDTYAKALRRIVAGVFEIGGTAKFNASRVGYADWLKKIDSIPLADLSPAAVLAWRNKFIASASTPVARGRASVTVNSLLRNAKALLSKKVRPFIEAEMLLPSPLFFEQISKVEEPPLRYYSTIDAAAILRAAKEKLATEDVESFKLLLLTLVCGLRRSEADTLLWSQFDFGRRVLMIQDTEFKRLKSKDSAGDIDLEPELCALLQSYMAKARSTFVLESPPGVRVREMADRKSRGYRCHHTQARLIVWLRKQGVHGIRPIHILRKEIGSLIASRDGIWQASRYLRHSDISITSKLYSDKKIPVTAGLGAMLATPADNVVPADFGARDQSAHTKGKKPRRQAR